MRKILVIEDTYDVLEEILEALQYEDFEAIGASNGVEGLYRAREDLPDLIICDVMMPELDGYGVLQELRNDSATSTIPFIFLTSRAEREALRRGMELGADDYVTKPFKLEELLAAIRIRLEKKDAIEKERLRALSHRLVEAQEMERRKIARELHDEVGQILTGLKMILSMSKRLSDAEMRLRLIEAQALVNEMMNRVSEMSLDLRPPMLDDLGILPTLLQHFKRYTAQFQIRVDFRHRGIERRFAPEIETAIYRIVQESLTNIARHTSVQNASVHIWADDELVNVQVEDQGEGFAYEAAVNAGNYAGLMGMQERAMLLGGRVTVTSNPGEGTRVIAQLPTSPVGEEKRDTRTAAVQVVSPALPPASAPPLEIPKASATGFAIPDEAAADQEVITIVLADSHILTRQGLRSLLEARRSFSIMAEATSGDETINMVERFQPQVLILSLDVGLDVIDELNAYEHNPYILVLSMYDDEAYVLEALRKGAMGYALKESSAEELIQAIYQVASGQRYLSQSLSERVIDFYINTQQAEDISLTVYGALTGREREVFQMVINGARNLEIADALFISPRTVETHRSNMMRKLGLRTQADLIRYAMQRGLIDTES